VSQPGLGGRDKRTRRHLSINASAAQVIAAMITALGAVAAAFVGGAFAGPRIGLVVAQPAVTITATVTRPAISRASPGGGSGTQTSPGTVLFQKKSVQLTRGYQLSFIDHTLRPFVVGNGTACGSGDLYVSTCFAYVYSSALLTVVSGRAGFAQCQADTTYLTGAANENGNSLLDSTLCVTTGHSVAACYVTSDTTKSAVAAPGLIMDVTVYASK
jgi:hypothetical protein